MSALTEGERQQLLDLAESALRSGVRGRPVVQPQAQGALAEPAGCFVTLRRRGELRGCIGVIETDAPLAQSIVEMAQAAALRDPRFAPVSAAELPEIDVEVSVLEVPREIHDPASVHVGEHGLIVSRGNHRGVLLPQVASDRGWDVATFLAETCRKAGLGADAWRDPGTRVEVFGATVID